ncbi:MAG: OmpH family outer membrane protein [Blastocatellia bacterium]
MKRLLYSFALSGLLAFAAIAQTPKPATRPAATNPAPSTPTPAGGTGAEGKVAQITLAQLGQGVNELKVKIDALNAEFQPVQKELKAMEEELLSLKNKIQTQGATVSAQVRSQWMDEGTEKEKLYKRKAEDAEQQGQKRLADVTQPIYAKILKFLESFCQQRGIVMVMEAGAAYQSGVLVWAVPVADITDELMKEYNKANPVAAGTASPAGAKKP